MYDFLIVGAGFAGSVLAERIATQLNKKVLIVDKRNHIGGNAFDFYDENGLLIHKYGPHIFHTNSKKVFDYLSNFTEWRLYFHKVLAIVEGRKVPIPFNLNSIYKLFSPNLAKKLEDELINTFGYGKKISILKLKETSKDNLKWLADYIYKNVFLGYTLKQWELKPEELDISVTSRVPVYISRDDRYFQDIYQVMPKKGYTELFKNLLSQKNIHILLNTDYKEIINEIKFNKMIYTGPIDEYFDYIYGELPYRSLKFNFIYQDLEYLQEVGTINYPNDYDFTRITEFKHLTGQKTFGTTYAIEFPEKFKKDLNEPYYPIPNNANNELYNEYKSENDKISENVIFVGRLADYKYYNMDQIVARALHLFEEVVLK